MFSLLLVSALAAAGVPAPPPACPAPTGASATVIVPAAPALTSPVGPLVSGDVVTVVTADGTCIGGATWDGVGLALTLWADDPFTPAVDGFVPGDVPSVRVYDASTGTDYATGINVAFLGGFDLAEGLAADRLYIVAEATPAVAWISEVDAVAADAGSAFVEIGGVAPGETLHAVTLVAVDAQARVTGTAGLDGVVADAGGFAVVRADGAAQPADATLAGVAQFDTTAAAFALYNASQAPAVGATATTAGLLDAIAYGGPAASRAPALLAALGLAVQFRDTPETSLVRLTGAPAGAGRLSYAAAPTPGSMNPALVSVAAVPRPAGLRLVSAPVLSAEGTPLTVADLMPLGPIQGIPGSPEPDAAPTIWTGLAGGTFVAAASTGVPLPPGAGALWQTDGAPLVLAGVPLDDARAGGPTVRAVATSADGLYLVGNPYAYPFRVSGLSVNGGTLQSSVAAWDPAAQTYVDLFDRDDAPADVLAAWDGAIAEVSGATGPTLDLVTTSAATDPSAPAGPASDAVPALNFDLAGLLADGTAVADRSAHVRWLTDATAGWDRHDGTKLMPPTADYALIAPVGTRDGAPRRQRVLSLPSDATSPIRLAFSATGAGTFTLHWSATADVAGLELADLETGTTVHLADVSEYAFTTAGAAAWSERFEIRPTTTTATEPLVLDAATVGRPFPNPTTTTATLHVRVPTPQRVVAEVFDALGRRVAMPFDGEVSIAGADVHLDAQMLPPGLYVVRVRGESFVETRRVTVVR